MTINSVLELSNLKFGWQPNSTLINIESFNIERGESVFLQGASGSGKSTLLGLISGVIPFQSGRIKINNQNIGEKTSAMRDRIRADHLGIIFQQFNLLPYLSVVNNVTLPCRFSQLRKQRNLSIHQSPQAAAKELLGSLGLPMDLINAPVSELSVGQQQRVAVARALIGGPDLIIADEPTTALDVSIQAQILDLIRNLCKTRNLGVIIVTHDIGVIANIADRVAVMYRGEIVETGPVAQIIGAPQHEYTVSLIAAVPPADRKLERFNSVDYTNQTMTSICVKLISVVIG